MSEYRARTLDLSYRGRAAAFSATVRLTASEAAWLARHEREDLDESTLRECMSGADQSALVVDPTVTATNGMSVSASLPSEEEDRQVRQSERPVPCTYTHRDGMSDDGTVWGWTALAERFGASTEGPAANRKPDHLVSAAAKRKRAQRMREREQAAKRTEAAQREQVEAGTALDFDAVMRAMAASAASGTGLDRE